MCGGVWSLVIGVGGGEGGVWCVVFCVRCLVIGEWCVWRGVAAWCVVGGAGDGVMEWSAVGRCVVWGGVGWGVLVLVLSALCGIQVTSFYAFLFCFFGPRHTESPL